VLQLGKDGRLDPHLVKVGLTGLHGLVNDLTVDGRLR
jgi:hypothetical protein